MIPETRYRVTSPERSGSLPNWWTWQIRKNVRTSVFNSSNLRFKSSWYRIIKNSFQTLDFPFTYSGTRPDEPLANGGVSVSPFQHLAADVAWLWLDPGISTVPRCRVRLGRTLICLPLVELDWLRAHVVPFVAERCARCCRFPNRSYRPTTCRMA